MSADFKTKKLADLDKNHAKIFGTIKSQEMLCFTSKFANHNVIGP